MNRSDGTKRRKAWTDGKRFVEPPRVSTPAPMPTIFRIAQLARLALRFRYGADA